MNLRRFHFLDTRTTDPWLVRGRHYNIDMNFPRGPELSSHRANGSEPIRNVTAAILAGGLGTRLRSAVADRPKVLAEVGGRPFLAHLLDAIALAGVRKTVLLVGHAADRVRSTFGDRFAGMQLAYSTEYEPLGTGGAVRLALPHFQEDDVLLLNGDSYCDVALRDFWSEHRVVSGRASMVLARVDDPSRYGRVRVGPDGRIVEFQEKGANGPGGWINAGIYLIPRTLAAEIPVGRPVSLEREILSGWVGGVGIGGFPGGSFIDIGTPESYRAAEAFFASLGLASRG